MKDQIRIVFLVVSLIVAACADAYAQDLLDVFLPKEKDKVKVITFVYIDELRDYEKLEELVYYRPGRGVKENDLMIKLIEMESTVFKDTIIDNRSVDGIIYHYDPLGRVVMIVSESKTMPADVWYDTTYYSYGTDDLLQSIRSIYGNFGKPMLLDELGVPSTSEILIHRNAGQVVSATETCFNMDRQTLTVLTYHFKYRNGLLVELIFKNDDKPIIKYKMKY